PDALQDFCVADTSSSTIFMNGLPCLNPNQVSAKNFTTSVLSSAGNTSGNPFGVSLKTTTTQFLPGINTLGLIMARVDLAGLSTLASSTPTNKLFSAEIKTGDVFVFPRGIIHFVHNIGNTPASVIAALNSQAPGNSVIPLATFASNPAIPNQVLAKSFQINIAE
ncbi:hypothetical protein KI387_042301, partial [Taxus chinensis]